LKTLKEKTLKEKTLKEEEVPTPEPVLESSSAPEADPDTESPSVSSWGRALRFWRQAPALARGMALVIPLMAPTMFLGSKLSLQAQPTRPGSWASAIKARATVDLQDDFKAGFSAWGGKPGWDKTWSIDGSGSAQPGRLALYTPTIPLTDYRLEFVAQLMSKALGVAIRAADTDNYQAVKLVIAKPGPLSSLTMTRYAVIDGHEGPKTEVPISLTVRNDTLYKLLILVQGDHFSVTVNGVFADAWTNERLKSGGVGFFADKGEISRVRSVHVVDKEDFLGWLCYQVSQWTADRPPIGEKHE
jgi:hypothetical protein